LALLIGSGGLEPERVAETLRLTFERRKTHALPLELVPPPPDWQGRFRALAEECGLPTDVAAVFAGVQEYFKEVLTRRTER
jgi:ATP phosphoribosyltransferase regulatory subunit HisZ